MFFFLWPVFTEKINIIHNLKLWGFFFINNENDA